MGWGAPVTAPMDIPPEVYRSPLTPPDPELKELPIITDAQTKGLRLQGTLAKALPPIKQAGSMTNVRQMEAEQYAQEIGAAFSESRAYLNRSKAIAKAKGRQAERAAQMRNKSGGKSASSRSRYNARRAKGRSFNAAFEYGYDPRLAMR